MIVYPVLNNSYTIVLLSIVSLSVYPVLTNSYTIVLLSIVSKAPIMFIPSELTATHCV